jgi:hypothetical protein
MAFPPFKALAIACPSRLASWGKLLHLNRRTIGGAIAPRFKCKLSELSAKLFAFDWRAAEKPDPLALRFKCK